MAFVLRRIRQIHLRNNPPDDAPLVTENAFAYFYTNADRRFPCSPSRRPSGCDAALRPIASRKCGRTRDVRAAGCPWCRNWDREIATIYPKTPEGAKAPLRRVSLDRPLAPEWKLDPPVFYSPTFVILDKGREIGRITGYSNAESFWGLLGPFWHVSISLPHPRRAQDNRHEPAGHPSQGTLRRRSRCG